MGSINYYPIIVRVTTPTNFLLLSHVNNNVYILATHYMNIDRASLECLAKTLITGSIGEEFNCAIWQTSITLEH